MTPTKAEGIVEGKVYRIVEIPAPGDVSIGIDVGTLVKLDRDDGTTLPYFRTTDLSGEQYGTQIVLRVAVVKLEPVDFDPTSADYSIKVENGTTTLVFKKSLSVNQIHAVLAAAGL